MSRYLFSLEVAPLEISEKRARVERKQSRHRGKRCAALTPSVIDNTCQPKDSLIDIGREIGMEIPHQLISVHCWAAFLALLSLLSAALPFAP